MRWNFPVHAALDIIALLELCHLSWFSKRACLERNQWSSSRSKKQKNLFFLGEPPKSTRFHWIWWRFKLAWWRWIADSISIAYFQDRDIFRAALQGWGGGQSQKLFWKFLWTVFVQPQNRFFLQRPPAPPFFDFYTKICIAVSVLLGETSCAPLEQKVHWLAFSFGERPPAPPCIACYIDNLT